jgi:hypothetical protein
MSICALYKDFKDYRKFRKDTEGKMLCHFIPLNDTPWSEMLKPDENGYATNKRGWVIVITPNTKHIYGEFPPKKV